MAAVVALPAATQTAAVVAIRRRVSFFAPAVRRDCYRLTRIRDCRAYIEGTE